MTNKQKKESVTISDIAKKLNIATSTVSRALNNNEKISEATKKKVQDVALELGYEISLAASSLVKKSTNLIGVIVPKVGSEFYADVINGIQEKAQEKGYKVIICQSDENVKQEIEMTKVLNATRVDGVIACLSMETKSVEHFKAFEKNNIPIVMFDRVSYDINGPKVVIDDYEAGYVAANHLIKIGRENIAHLSGNTQVKAFEDRTHGFKDALKEHKLPLHPQFLLSCDLSEKDIRTALKMWMNGAQKPDAIITSSAQSGLILTTVLKSMGYNIPEDLSIITLGNTASNEFITPTLSAINIPGKEIGRASFDEIFTCIKEGKSSNNISVKPIQLLIRNSSFKA
ncbi:LacI family DNA-binding transcriptional regulator [Flammeovirga aprica]|uniref:LacI family transcriptional regulator n=1 Tax=Flammeovirga aprica JL-4 TaxID=694437 RepID=A0A7X9XAV2_9BACT|nr:LacI family DNA-binding transcriptional regulator [Flammeovirga aprica]NME70062.1 LacI family transcriptional regulator [Flammeovirga aprica JL-4]